MQEYINFCRIESFHKAKPEYKLSPNETKKRDVNDKNFADEWDNGVKMDWKYTPVEQQKPQVNWRQDINMDDKAPKRLDSFPISNGIGGSGLNPESTIGGGKDDANVSGHLAYMKQILEGKITFGSSGSGDKDTKDGNSGNSSQAPDYTEQIKANITKGFARISEDKVKEAIGKMASAGYDQELQELCKQNNIDACLAFSIIVIASGGVPSEANQGKGLFGFDGADTSSLKAQLESGIKYLKELTSKYGSHGNTLPLIQSINKWDTAFNSVNNKDQKYDDKYYIAVNGKSDLTYPPCIFQTYEYVKKNMTCKSQITSGSVNGQEFPVQTSDLQYVSISQEYGVESTKDGKVLKVSNALYFKIEKEIKIFTPFTGYVVENGENNNFGKFIKIKNTEDNDIIIIGGLTKILDLKGEGIEKHMELGSVNSKLIIQFIAGSDNKVKDPKVLWPLLEDAKVGDNLSELIKKRAIKSS